MTKKRLIGHAARGVLYFKILHVISNTDYLFLISKRAKDLRVTVIRKLDEILILFRHIQCHLLQNKAKS
jgi:hypothetical protein